VPYAGWLLSAVRLTGLDARLDRTGAMPEQQSAAHPFIKPKWDERAYFLVQDSIWEAMDDGCVADMHSRGGMRLEAASRGGGV
jgi:hypothetical protein